MFARVGPVLSRPVAWRLPSRCSTGLDASPTRPPTTAAPDRNSARGSEVFSPAASGHGRDDECGGDDVADSVRAESDVAQGSVALEDGVGAFGGRA